MTEEQVNDIILSVVEKLKKTRDDTSWTDFPDFYPTYKEAVKYMYEIRPHTEKGVFPESIFIKRSPNQTEKEEKWYRDNHKQITLPLFVDLISTIQKVFHDANYEVKYAPEKDTTSFRDYVENRMPLYGSLENFVKSILPPIKEVDANGCVVIKPKEVPTVENNGRLIIDPDIPLEPLPYYYASWQKVAYEPGEYYLFLMKERSKVEFGNTLKDKGFIFELYESENIWRITQSGRYLDYIFEIELYYNHGWGRVPVEPLRGVPVYRDGVILWQSQFLYVVDLLNEVILDNSYLMASKAKVAYPYRISIGKPCDYHDTQTGDMCRDGFIWSDDITKKRICHVCNGSGMKSRFSPQGEMLIDIDVFHEKNIRPSEAVHFAQPDTTGMKFLREEIGHNLSKSYNMLHIPHSDRSINFNFETKTATGSDNNNKAQQAFLKPIAFDLFYIYEFLLKGINWMMNKGAVEDPVLTYPVTFDFITQEDFISQLKEARDSQQPPAFIYALMHKFLSSLFYTEKESADIFDLLLRADRFVTLSNAEIEMKVQKGFAERWEAIVHDSGINFVNELIAEDQGFMNLSIEEKIARLQQKAKNKASEINPNATRDNIINTIANIATPEEE